MGLFRKLTSAARLGAVEPKSDKERSAETARKTQRTTDKRNRLLEEQNRLMRAHFFGR